MKQLTCELCGGVDLVKQDGYFVCQHCGTKYTVEEARKLMIEGTVEVQGTVKVDNTEELRKLYQAARNARETSDDQTALRHYERISAMDPNSWEALFYLVILKTNSIKNSQIQSAANSVSNCLPTVFSLIKETIPDEQGRKSAVKEVVETCNTTAKWLTSASHSFYKSVTKGNGIIALTGLTGAISSAGSTLNHIAEDSNRCFAIANIMCHCGNYVEEHFDMEDEDYCLYAVWSWKKMMGLHEEFCTVHPSQPLFNDESIITFTKKIQQYSRKTAANSNEAMVTIRYEITGGAAPELWFTVDGGEKHILKYTTGQKLLSLSKGTHTIAVLNPLAKKKYNVDITDDQVILFKGTAWGIKMI